MCAGRWEPFARPRLNHGALLRSETAANVSKLGCARSPTGLTHTECALAVYAPHLLAKAVPPHQKAVSSRSGSPLRSLHGFPAIATVRTRCQQLARARTMRGADSRQVAGQAGRCRVRKVCSRRRGRAAAGCSAAAAANGGSPVAVEHDFLGRRVRDSRCEPIYI